MGDKIEIIINFDKYNPKYEEISSIFSRYLIKTEGFYKKNNKKIQKALDTTSRGMILEVLWGLDKANALELRNILGLPYSLINQYINTLKRLKLIVLKEGISSKGRQEMAIRIHPNVHITKYSDFVKSKEFKELVSDEEKFAVKSESCFHEMMQDYKKKNLNKRGDRKGDGY